MTVSMPMPTMSMPRACRPMAALLVAGALAAACGEGPDRGDADAAVRLQLNWVPEPEFGGIYAAELGGAFREAGLAVEILKGGPGVPAPQLLAAGQVEFAVISSDELLLLNAKGGDLVAIFAIFQHDPMAIMVHASSPWDSLESLWGSDATVACDSNAPYVAFLDRRYGGERLRRVAHQGSVASFTNDPRLAQQCFVFSEPVTLELAGVPTRVFPVGASGYDPYRAVVAVRRETLETRRELCERMAEALRAGWRAYLDAPAAANAVMSELNPAMGVEAMDLAAVRQAPFIETDLTRRHELGWMEASRWRQLAEQLQSIGLLEQVPEGVEGFFHQPPATGSLPATGSPPAAAAGEAAGTV
jgi:NitT/TauT family transport system substrate-binding protein